MNGGFKDERKSSRMRRPEIDSAPQRSADGLRAEDGTGSRLSTERMAADLIGRGVRQIHVLAWRDLDDPEAGGSEIHADEFMRRWQAAGLEVLHRTSGALGKPETDLRNGYRIVRKGGRLGVFPSTVFDEIRKKMGGYDAVVEIWNGVPWLTPIWSRKPHIVILHHVHDQMWSQTLPKPAAWIGRHLESTVAPPLYRRTHTVTLCEDSAADLTGLGWRPDRLHIAHAGVDPFFSPGEQRTSHPSIVAVGRLAPVKRFIDLLDQFENVRMRVPDARLTIVGEGPERRRLEQWIREREASAWVELAGRVDRESLRNLYRESWLIASASLAEGWGLTLTEAAGCGTPAVATDIGGHRSAVLDGRTGWLTDLDSLGDRCADLLLDTDTRESMGTAALQWARSLSWDRLAENVLRPLHRIVIEKR